MPKIEKKEFMTLVIPIHCGDPLENNKQYKQTKIKFRRTKKYFISQLCYGALFLEALSLACLEIR